MENSKQRLYQKSLWQAVNLLSQLPHVCTPYPSPPSCLDPWAGRAVGPLRVGGHALSGCMAFPFVMNLQFRRGSCTVHRTLHFTNRETGHGRSRVISSKLVVVRPRTQISCLPVLDTWPDNTLSFLSDLSFRRWISSPFINILESFPIPNLNLRF